MAEERPGEGSAEDLAGLRARAAVTVRQAHELWPRAQENPREAVFPLVVEHLTTLERLLPAVFSYAPSGGQFLRAAGRDRLPLAEGQVLVTDPLLTLVWAEVETEALRSAYYPGARRFGEHVAADVVPDAPGSGADLLSVLPGGEAPAAVVHVSCHGVAGPSPTRPALSPADGELTVARILDEAAPATAPAAGPLVALSACETDLSTGDHDEALTLSTALVARGAADVVGSRWPWTTAPPR